MTQKMRTRMATNEYNNQDKARQEVEWRKIKKNFWYFVDEYCWMWVKEGGDPIRFRLRPYQMEDSNTFQHTMKVIILKARQMGLSWLLSAYALWKCMTKSNFHAYYNSIGLKEVQEQMERVRFIFMNLPDWLQHRGFMGGKNCKNNDSIIEFENGSALHATASGKSAGHGASPGLIICDEWARVDEATRKWRALKPSAGRNTQIFVISTSDGFGNHFAELWIDAKAGVNGFKPIFHSWMENPEYSTSYIEEQRRDFAGDLQGFKEAYPETPEDAFLSSSRSVFDIERIREWKQNIRDLEAKGELVVRTGYLDWNDKQGDEKKIIFIDNPMESLLVWKEPVKGHRYSMGVDVAEGLIGGDYSAFVVIDIEKNEVVAMYRGKIAPEMYSHPIEMCAKWYFNAWLAVEVNTASDLIMSDLKQTYPWLYMRPQRARITDLPTLVPGFYTSGTSKMRIITQMRRAFSSEEKPLIIYSDVLLDEMSFYEQDDKKSLGASTGHHDDTVMACAIAIEAGIALPYLAEVQNQKIPRGRDWRCL
jgi:hypothetical protein